MRQFRRNLAAFMIAVAIATGGILVDASEGAKPPTLEFLGQAIVPTGTTFDATTIGGLSSITYDADSGVFYALSDDQGTFNPARYYTLTIDVSDGSLANGDVQFVDVTTLLAPNALPYPAASLDPEGLTLTKSGELIVTAEGNTPAGAAPWVRRYAIDGTYLGDLLVPTAFTPGPTQGVRFNLGFEAAAVAPDGRHLFVGTEGALLQDGSAATINNGSYSRVLRYNLSTGKLDRQYVYLNDPVAETPVPPTAFSVNGLVELLPFNTQVAIAMERSFSVGAPDTGNTIKLYYVKFAGADNVNGEDSLSGILEDVRVVEKTLLLNLDTLGIPLDNIEGMTLGPRLPDGRRSLILVSDNNFSGAQFTQFLLFALD